MSGGLAEPWQRTSIADDGAMLTLQVLASDPALYGDTVARRRASLANALGRKALITG